MRISNFIILIDTKYIWNNYFGLTYIFKFYIKEVLKKWEVEWGKLVIFLNNLNNKICL